MSSVRGRADAAKSGRERSGKLTVCTHTHILSPVNGGKISRHAQVALMLLIWPALALMLSHINQQCRYHNPAGEGPTMRSVRGDASLLTYKRALSSSFNTSDRWARIYSIDWFTISALKKNKMSAQCEHTNTLWHHCFFNQIVIFFPHSPLYSAICAGILTCDRGI